MSTTYTDILLADLETVRPEIRQKGEVRKNLAGDRCIIKWEGDTPSCVRDLGCTHSTHDEALAYYNDPVNEWCKEVDII